MATVIFFDIALCTWGRAANRPKKERGDYHMSQRHGKPAQGIGARPGTPVFPDFPAFRGRRRAEPDEPPKYSGRAGLPLGRQHRADTSGFL